MPLGKVTLLRSKLSFVGRNGYVPFASMIVEWNPQTVKRRPGEWTSCWTRASASVASTGGSGRSLWAHMPRRLTTQPAGDDPQFSQRNFRWAIGTSPLP